MKTSEPELATGWPLSRVDAYLQSKNVKSLTEFLDQRYREKFLKPIEGLRSAAESKRGYGFSIMALCSLLVETLQCYRYGLPTTHEGEYRELDKLNPPAQYRIPPKERRNGLEVFKAFFSFPAHQLLFPKVDGEVFYRSIRNGLLHQAQTKQGWRIRTGEASLWDDSHKTLDRSKFASALDSAFRQYIEELTRSQPDEDLWIKARRKIWWLLTMSS